MPRNEVLGVFSVFGESWFHALVVMCIKKTQEIKFIRELTGKIEQLIGC